LLAQRLSDRIRGMMQGKLLVERKEGAHRNQHVLCLRGPVTLETVSVFQEAVRAASAAPALILDLSEVPFVDSSALGAFVQVYVSCQKTNRRLALAGLGHRVRGLLQISGLDLLFVTFPTVAEAEQALA
jgi:anti-sigma B factor antagonist